MHEMIIPALIPTLGFPELVVIFLIIILLFGARKLPEIARSMGKSIHEFKNGVKEIRNNVKEGDKPQV
jgi:sec-independent protein translocase protein TatA